ncbi:MAG: asparaginase [Rhodospirillales bacterium]
MDSHAHGHGPSPSDSSDPVLVEYVRGGMVESRHRGAAVIIDSNGNVIEKWGDVARPIYARSALKPIQAIPLVESGAAEKFALSDVEVALACASHGGEPRHVKTVTAWLDKIGLSVADLECGAHPPSHLASANAMVAAGQKPSALHNNCSGKHTGFLSTAVHKGEKTKGYIRLDHPVQQRILGILEQLSESDLQNAPKGIDGCGIPVIGVPLEKLALAFARMARPAGLPKSRIAAIARIRKAMSAEPFMVAGTGRPCTRIMEKLGEQVQVKMGAEGVFIAMLPHKGIGIALKMADGANRAAEIAMLALLRRAGLYDKSVEQELAQAGVGTILNVAGREVGAIRAAAELAT